MYIWPSTKISDIEKNGTVEQKSVATYFDKNGDNIIDVKEADSFNYSKISKTDDAITITSKDGYVDKFVSLDAVHPESYYESGSIPVAVIDGFSTDGEKGWHGNWICNILKNENSNIAITKFNDNAILDMGFVKSKVCKKVNSAEAMEFFEKHKILKNIIFSYMNFDKHHNNMLVKSLQDVKQQIDMGKKFEAVNLSQSQDIEYPDINLLVQNELGIEITPTNVGKYKNEIKQILKQKQNIKIQSPNAQKEIKVKDIIEIIEAVENVGVPIYLAASYKNGDKETFNLYSLADNALTIEAGVEQDGKIIHNGRVSHSSLSLDGNGNRRITDSLYYQGELVRGANSFAAPKVLANDLKQKYGN